MAQMDHSEAIQLQAAVKYVLGELSLVQREEYEEHYFDCAECAIDLKAAAAFVDTTREVLRQEKASSFAKEAVPARGGWLRWFQPVTAVPAFAALLLIFIYQNTVTIPRAREEATQIAGQLFTSSFSLQMANTRGGEEVKVQVHPKESFALDFDFTPSRSFESYVCQLQDESGRSVLQVNVPGSSANKEAHLVVPGGLVRPGRYTMVFSGTPVSKGQPPRDEVLRLHFVVAFL
jgi:Putative zinc-finger